MIEAPVAKGMLASSSIAGPLLGVALIGGGAYYLFKRFGKKSEEQTVKGDVVEQSQEAVAEAVPA